MTRKIKPPLGEKEGKRKGLVLVSHAPFRGPIERVLFSINPSEESTFCNDGLAKGNGVGVGNEVSYINLIDKMEMEGDPDVTVPYIFYGMKNILLHIVFNQNAESGKILHEGLWPENVEIGLFFFHKDTRGGIRPAYQELSRAILSIPRKVFENYLEGEVPKKECTIRYVSRNKGKEILSATFTTGKLPAIVDEPIPQEGNEKSPDSESGEPDWNQFTPPPLSTASADHTAVSGSDIQTKPGESELQEYAPVISEDMFSIKFWKRSDKYVNSKVITLDVTRLLRFVLYSFISDNRKIKDEWVVMPSYISPIRDRSWFLQKDEFFEFKDKTEAEFSISDETKRLVLYHSGNVLHIRNIGGWQWYAGTFENLFGIKSPYGDEKEIESEAPDKSSVDEFLDQLPVNPAGKESEGYFYNKEDRLFMVKEGHPLSHFLSFTPSKKLAPIDLGKTIPLKGSYGNAGMSKDNLTFIQKYQMPSSLRGEEFRLSDEKYHVTVLGYRWDLSEKMEHTIHINKNEKEWQCGEAVLICHNNRFDSSALDRVKHTYPFPEESADLFVSDYHLFRQAQFPLFIRLDKYFRYDAPEITLKIQCNNRKLEIRLSGFTSYLMNDVVWLVIYPEPLPAELIAKEARYNQVMNHYSTYHILTQNSVLISLVRPYGKEVIVDSGQVTFYIQLGRPVYVRPDSSIGMFEKNPLLGYFINTREEYQHEMLRLLKSRKNMETIKGVIHTTAGLAGTIFLITGLPIASVVMGMLGKAGNYLLDLFGDPDFQSESIRKWLSLIQILYNVKNMQRQPDQSDPTSRTQDALSILENIFSLAAEKRASEGRPFKQVTIQRTSGIFLFANTVLNLLETENTIRFITEREQRIRSILYNGQEEFGKYHGDEYGDMLLLWNVRRYYYDRYNGQYEWGEDKQMDMIFTPVRYAQRVIRHGRQNRQRIEIDDIPLPLDYHAGTLGLSTKDGNNSWHYVLKTKLVQFIDGYQQLRESIEKEEIYSEDVKLHKHIRGKLSEKDPELIDALKGVSSLPFHFCKDTSCNHILESDEKICPNSFAHAGWEEEGVLKEIASEILKIYNHSFIKEDDKKLLLKLSSNTLKINKNNKNLIQKTISKYAPFELLTDGWGLLEKVKDKRQKKKENESDMWIKMNNKNTKVLKKYYLIYKKEDDYERE